MTAQEQSTLRTLIFHDQQTEPVALPAYRLLNELGHDVSTSGSAADAVNRLRKEHPNLVIVDADDPDQREFVSQLSSLPKEQQPEAVAIFSDSLDESLSGLVKRLQNSRVHVLLKPLHMHGLLSILRNIESKV